MVRSLVNKSRQQTIYQSWPQSRSWPVWFECLKLMKCNWKFIGFHGDRAAPEFKFSASRPVSWGSGTSTGVQLELSVITTRDNSYSPSSQRRPAVHLTNEQLQLQWGAVVSGIIVHAHKTMTTTAHQSVSLLSPLSLFSSVGW